MSKPIYRSVEYRKVSQVSSCRFRSTTFVIVLFVCSFILIKFYSFNEFQQVTRTIGSKEESPSKEMVQDQKPGQIPLCKAPRSNPWKSLEEQEINEVIEIVQQK